MATKFVYEPQYVLSGWVDDGGMSQMSWYDRDVASDVIPLVVAYPSMFSQADVFFVLPPLTVEIFPSLFVDKDTFFEPHAVQALNQPDQMLKNEVRRVR